MGFEGHFGAVRHAALRPRTLNYCMSGSSEDEYHRFFISTTSCSFSFGRCSYFLDQLELFCFFLPGSFMLLFLSLYLSYSVLLSPPLHRFYRPASFAFLSLFILFLLCAYVLSAWLVLHQDLIAPFFAPSSTFLTGSSFFHVSFCISAARCEKSYHRQTTFSTIRLIRLSAIFGPCNSRLWPSSIFTYYFPCQ